MQSGLVSMLTPMYNTGKYVYRLLDSVLLQTYPKIEMIVVDDGSTDNSADVVKGYVKRFVAKGYTLKYVYQKNAGQSVAVKNGLKMVNGEYLTWPDSDDFYASDEAIAKMVDVLKQSSQEFQMVRAQATMLSEDTLLPIGMNGKYAGGEEPSTLFYDCLTNSNGFYFCTGAYMVRTAALYETTHFDIYTSKHAGQNWQLMLPILYKYRCITIPLPLFNSLVRADSHSRGQYKGYYAVAAKYNAYLNTRVETLRRIKGFPENITDMYEKEFSDGYNRKLFKLALRENRRHETIKGLKTFDKNAGISLKRRILYSLLYVKGGTYIVNALMKLRRMLS